MVLVVIGGSFARSTRGGVESEDLVERRSLGETASVRSKSERERGVGRRGIR